MKVHGKMEILGRLFGGLGLSPVSALPPLVELNSIVNLNGVLYKCVANVSDVSSYAEVYVKPTLKTYRHTQLVSSKTWTINHNMQASTPLFKVYDSTYKELAYTAAQSDSAGNVLTLTFSANKTGFVTLMSF